MSEAATRAMDAAKLTAADVDLMIPHQANVRIIEATAKHANIPMDKVYVNVDRFGNTSAASIPIALDEAIECGRIGEGSTVLLVAFGAGFTFGPLIAFFGLELFGQQPWGVGVLASLLSLVALVTAWRKFQETRQPGNLAAKELFSVSKTVEVLKMPAVGMLVLVYFLTIFAFANFEATLARLTDSAFKMSDRDNFLVFAAVGAVLMCAGGAYRPLAKKQNEVHLLTAGLWLMVLGLFGLFVVGVVTGRPADGTPATASWPKPLFYVAMGVAVIGFAFVNPSVSSLVSKKADPTRQGEVLGVNQALLPIDEHGAL